MNNIGKYSLRSRGRNWFHFRTDPCDRAKSFSVTYCHDGSVCMTGDMGCLTWQRVYFPEIPDYGFPYADTGIGYFAEKVVRAEGSQVTRSWNQDVAIADIKAVLVEDRSEHEQDRKALFHVYDCLPGFESGEYGYFQMLKAFEDVPHEIEDEEIYEFGRDYSDSFKLRFELLRSVSQLIIDAASEMTETIKTNEVPPSYLAPAYQTPPLDDLGVNEAAKKGDASINKGDTQ